MYEKSVTRTFLNAFFWVPVPFKRYQNTSGCGSAVLIVVVNSQYIAFFRKATVSSNSGAPYFSYLPCFCFWSL